LEEKNKRVENKIAQKRSLFEKEGKIASVQYS
jgi:hypothetical protein